MAEKIKQIDFDDTMQDFFYTYAMDVNTDRAIPTLVDGLKPVARRILYDMWQTGISSTSPHKKVMSVVGDTMAKYHPHGESGIEDALVNMGASHKVVATPIDGHGNYGSIDDVAASSRYIECRLSKYAEQVMLKDLTHETVPYVPNFTDEFWEPTVLPAVLPNILIYPNIGIGVAYKCNYLPHNPRDVVELCIGYVKNRNMSIEEMAKLLKGPDFPSGGEIHGTDRILEAYKTGKKKLKVRGTYRTETIDGYPTIVITSLPYRMPKYRKESGKEAVGAMVIINQIIEDGLIDVKYVGDESDKNNPIRIVVQLRKGEDVVRVVNLLMVKGVLETEIAVEHNALIDETILKQVSLSDIMSNFISFREEVLHNKFTEELKHKNDRINILEGLFKVSDKLDKAIAMIRQSKDTYAVLKEKFMKAFDLNDRQAEYILQMQLRRLSGLEMTDYQKEFNELQDRVKVLVKLTESKSNKDIDKYMIDEWTKLVSDKGIFSDKKYDRRTIIIDEYVPVNAKAAIKSEPCSIIRSSMGYLKKVSYLGDNTQNRGTQGLSVATGAEDDAIAEVLNTTTVSDVFVITSRGRIYKTLVDNIPMVNNKARGKLARNVLKIKENEDIVRMFTSDNIDTSGILSLITETGYIKCVKLADITNVKSNGKRLIDISNSDRIVSAIPTTTSNNILIATRDGLGLYTKLSDIRVSNTGSGGIRVMKLSESDKIVSAVTAKDDDQIIIISTNGFVKRIKISEFNTKGRGGAGVNIAPKGGDYGDIADVCLASDVLTILTRQGKCLSIRTDDIRLCGRNSKGVKSINLIDNDVVETIV